MRFLIALFPGCPIQGPGQSGMLRFENFLEAYYLLFEAGADLVLASPDGGYPMMHALDHARRGPSPFTERFQRDRLSRESFADTLRLDQIVVEDFDGAFCIGATNPAKGGRVHAMALGISRGFLDAGKPVAFIPGGIAAELSPIDKSLLMIGGGADSPCLAARALLGTAGRPRD